MDKIKTTILAPEELRSVFYEPLDDLDNHEFIMYVCADLFLGSLGEMLVRICPRIMTYEQVKRSIDQERQDDGKHSCGGQIRVSRSVREFRLAIYTRLPSTIEAGRKSTNIVYNAPIIRKVLAFRTDDEVHGVSRLYLPLWDNQAAECVFIPPVINEEAARKYANTIKCICK